MYRSLRAEDGCYLGWVAAGGRRRDCFGGRRKDYPSINFNCNTWYQQRQIAVLEFGALTPVQLKVQPRYRNDLARSTHKLTTNCSLTT